MQGGTQDYLYLENGMFRFLWHQSMVSLTAQVVTWNCFGHTSIFGSNRHYKITFLNADNIPLLLFFIHIASIHILTSSPSNSGFQFIFLKTNDNIIRSKTTSIFDEHLLCSAFPLLKMAHGKPSICVSTMYVSYLIFTSQNHTSIIIPKLQMRKLRARVFILPKVRQLRDNRTETSIYCKASTLKRFPEVQSPTQPKTRQVHRIDGASWEQNREGYKIGKQMPHLKGQSLFSSS